MKALQKLVISREEILFSLYPNGYRLFDDSALEELDGDFIQGIPENELFKGVPALAYDVSADVFQMIQLRDNTEYEFAIEIPLSEEEFLIKCKDNILFPFCNNALRDIVKFNGPDSCMLLPNGKFKITGRFNFESRAGTSYLDLKIDEIRSFVVPVEVLTQKLDYYEEFQQLLQQISDYHAELLVRFDTATEATFGVSLDNEISPMSELMSFRRMFRGGRLSAYVREIVNNPSIKIKPTLVKEDLPFATNPDWIALSKSPFDYDYQIGGILKGYFSGYTPTCIPNRKIEQSNDTPDNRFVKSALLLLKERLVRLQQKMPKKYAASKVAMKSWHEELETLLMEPFWREIGPCYHYPNSMVLATRKGYREFLIFYLAFGLSIKMENEGSLLSIGGDIKPVFHLYEMWCYLMIHKILSSITGLEGKPNLTFAKKDKHFQRDLISKNDKPIIFNYYYGDQKVLISLYYNKNFKIVDDKTEQWADSYSGVFNPDVSISIAFDTQLHWLHFDAKYRLDMSKWKAELLDDNPKSSFKREDIHKMHTYRDAVLGTRGSYVLFPGSESNSEIYVRNPDKGYREEYLMPSVGAFPLKPTSTHVQSDQIQRIKGHIESCIVSLAMQGGSYKEETGFQ